MKKRVLLSAIAKDEAAYLPEWVAYHLNLGVDHIRVFVNNIDDNTREVLQKIAEVAPVSIFNADVYWQDKDLPIDKATKSTFLTKNRFQARSMSRMYRMATLEGYDYLLSIDVDEFLYLDGSSLPDFLETAKIEKAARFQWFNVSGDETEFVAPVAPEINGDWAPLHKLLIKTGLGDRIFESPHDLANFNNSACINYPSDQNSACIIHRYHRSHMEYLSMLGKGDVLHRLNGVKSNRVGFDTSPRTSLKLSKKCVSDFHDSFNRLIASADLVDELQVARHFVRTRAEALADAVNGSSDDEWSSLRMFDGTDLKPGSTVTKFWS